MDRPEFEITLGKDGTVTVRVTGVSGEKCIQLSDMLKEIIGHEESRQLTSEFYGPDGKVRMDVKTHTRLK